MKIFIDSHHNFVSLVLRRHLQLQTDSVREFLLMLFLKYSRSETNFQDLNQRNIFLQSA